MSFIIIISIGFFLGFKVKGAIVLWKEAKNIKYIQAVVEKVLGDNEIKLYKTKMEYDIEKENKQLEKEHKQMLRIKKFKGAV